MRAFLLALLVACRSSSPAPQQPAEPAPPPPEAQPAQHEHPPHAHGQSEHAQHAHAPPANQDQKATGPLGHRFEKAADWVPVFEGPKRDRWQKPAEVAKVIGASAGMTVVDLGAGTGYFIPHLARAVGPSGKVIALDIEADMVRHMNERAAKEGHKNVEARLVPFNDPQLATGSVDRIMIVNTWHHIPDRPAYSAKLAAALKPGGSVWVIDFTMESKIGPPKPHRLAPDAVIAELGAAGLAAELLPAKAEPFAEQYVVVARKQGRKSSGTPP